jgi:hypothetical protein
MMSFVLLLVMTLVVACGGGTDEPSDASSSSELAPEFASIDGWYNTEPLTLEGLQGSTVLLVFFSDT